MSDTHVFTIPKELAGVSNRQTQEIRDTLASLGKELGDISKNVKREEQIQRIMSQIDKTVSDGIDEVGTSIYTGSKKGRSLSIESDIANLSKTRLPKVDYDEFKKYLDTARRIANLGFEAYMNKKSYIDGQTLTSRLKTIKKGTSDTVEAIIRLGIRDGKSSFQIAKEIEQYVKRDRRGTYVAPWDLARREKGFSVSSKYKPKNVPAGSVDYNALRIARTELINNYRWARIDATRNKDWVIGWAWRLSGAHPAKDACDLWASHDEGLGPGVYSDAGAIASLGHPHCFCIAEVVTIFQSFYASYFARAEEKGLISPAKYSVPVT
jgi:hypothetical protein